MAFGGEDGGGVDMGTGRDIYRSPPPAKQPNLWEYKVTTVDSQAFIPLSKLIVEHLEEEGADGWECISHSSASTADYSNGHNMFVWKRFKQV